jgi:cyclic pyranopterin phosphate synthase
MDNFGRTIDYLRISVTDRCNEQCLYCMPEGYKGWESKPDHLTAEEIARVVRVATELGAATCRKSSALYRRFPAWKTSAFPPTA